jgi:hypothetical protein
VTSFLQMKAGIPFLVLGRSPADLRGQKLTLTEYLWLSLILVYFLFHFKLSIIIYIEFFLHLLFTKVIISQLV